MVLKFDMAASFPHKIDRFDIHQVLTQGSQGIVYLADDPGLNRKVAIKSVNLKTGFQLDGTTDQLLSEAHTVSQLSLLKTLPNQAILAIRTLG